MFAVIAIPQGHATAATAAIGINPGYGPPLTTIKLVGTGYCSTGCSPVAIAIGSLYVSSGVPVDSSGRFTTYVRIPGSARPGTTPVAATQTNATHRTISAQVSFTVTINQPPPITYPAPGHTSAPAGLPPGATTQAGTTRLANPSGTSAATSSPATTTQAPVSIPNQSTQLASQGASHHGLTWIIGLIVVGALAAAGVVMVRRRRHRSARR